MEKKIVFVTEEGGVAIITPTERALEKHTMEEIAEKDVPAGLPYKIVDADYIPSDRTFRDAWEVDVAELTDGVGGEYDMFITDPQHPNYVRPNKEEVQE